MNDNIGHGEKFTRKKDLAIAALLTEPTIESAAKKTGIGEATLWRWMQNEDFKETYTNAKGQVVDQALIQIQTVTSEAIETLRDLMTNAKNPPNTRVSAAKAVWELSLKTEELKILATRVEQLERIIT